MLQNERGVSAATVPVMACLQFNFWVPSRKKPIPADRIRLTRFCCIATKQWCHLCINLRAPGYGWAGLELAWSTMGAWRPWNFRTSCLEPSDFEVLWTTDTGGFWGLLNRRHPQINPAGYHSLFCTRKISDGFKNIVNSDAPVGLSRPLHRLSGLRIIPPLSPSQMTLTMIALGFSLSRFNCVPYTYLRGA
jgi:hypothetical protein